MSRSKDVSDLKGKMLRFVNGSKVIAMFFKDLALALDVVHVGRE